MKLAISAHRTAYLGFLCSLLASKVQKFHVFRVDSKQIGTKQKSGNLSKHLVYPKYFQALHHHNALKVGLPVIACHITLLLLLPQKDPSPMQTVSPSLAVNLIEARSESKSATPHTPLRAPTDRQTSTTKTLSPRPQKTVRQAPTTTIQTAEASNHIQAVEAHANALKNNALSDAPKDGVTSDNISESSPDSVQEPRFNAAYLNNPAPSYPPLSRRLGEEGKVVLRVLVDPSGRPVQIELNASSRSSRLDLAAQEAVSRWKFIPAKRGQETVPAWVLVPIIFTLKH